MHQLRSSDGSDVFALLITSRVKITYVHCTLACLSRSRCATTWPARTAGSAAQVVAARRAGQRVIGEAITSGLTLDEAMTWHANFTVAAQYVMSPPLRTERDRVALRNALAGGMLQIVGTDHAVFNSTQKAQGRHDFRKVANGVNGIEERLHVVWDTMVCSWRLKCDSDDKLHILIVPGATSQASS